MQQRLAGPDGERSNATVDQGIGVTAKDQDPPTQDRPTRRFPRKERGTCACNPLRTDRDCKGSFKAVQGHCHERMAEIQDRIIEGVCQIQRHYGDAQSVISEPRENLAFF